jgi:hypothetical protein
MDEIKRSFFELKFIVLFIDKKFLEFQNFFCEIMEKCYSGDFQRVRPWGILGDRKNDGYLKSERTLFQSYAPNEMKLANCIAKIDEDFRGALPYWKEYFDKWIFVHNSRTGLAPDILKKLLELEKENAPIKLGQSGFEELRQKIFTLNEDDITAILGPAPSVNDIRSVTFKELSIVLETVSREKTIEEPDIRPVPKDKIILNSLSDNVEVLLNAGMRKSKLVEDFFNSYYDPSFGDEVAEKFKKQYTLLKQSGLPPDIIFMEVQKFAGGNQGGTPGHEAAVLAVLAYLFENCDIFERMPSKEGRT